MERNCQTCHYCRMDTPAESVAMYGRDLGYGTCYGWASGDRVKAPATDGAACEHWWSPLDSPSYLPDGKPNREKEQAHE